MDKKISLSYTCLERFNDMPKKGENQRFCDKCQHHVTDSTNSANTEIKGKCGLFHVSQLNSISRTSVISKSIQSISLAALLGLILTPNVSIAQESSVSVNQTTEESNVEITGIIKDKETSDALPFVKVVVQHLNDTIHVAVTDFDGAFKFKIDTNKYTIKDVKLKIQIVGYENDSLSLTNEIKSLEIKLKAGVFNCSDPTYTTMGMILLKDDSETTLEEKDVSRKKNRNRKKN